VKNAAEISLVLEAHQSGNVTDIFGRFAEEFFGPEDAVAVEVIPGGHAQFAAEHTAEVILTDAHGFGNLPAREGARIVFV
jgi:hypothetical protein